MIENLIALEEGAGMVVVGIIGGLVAGTLLMFYRDVSVAERVRLLTNGFVANYGEKDLHLGWKSYPTFGPRDPILRTVGNEEGYKRYYPSTYAGAVKAVTFSLGVVVLGSSLLLIPFSGQGITGASWIIIGLAVGACFEHSVWLYARADFPPPEHDLLARWPDLRGSFIERLASRIVRRPES